MKTKSITTAILFALSFTSMFGQNQTKQNSETSSERKFSVSTTWLSFANFGEEKTNTPQVFKEKDSNWNNYFLFEPNLYIGFKF